MLPAFRRIGKPCCTCPQCWRACSSPMKTTLAEAASVRDAIVTGKAELAVTADAAMRELVTAHRDLAQIIRDTKAAQLEAAGASAMNMRRAADTEHRGTVTLAGGGVT